MGHFRQKTGGSVPLAQVIERKFAYRKPEPYLSRDMANYPIQRRTASFTYAKKNAIIHIKGEDIGTPVQTCLRVP